MNDKITLKKTLLHFKKICIHKFWVAYYCFKCGLYWQGLTHDLSKFSWIEFWESVKYYQGDKSPIPTAKKEQGYSLAWQHHKGHNPHHYEYWTDNYDNGTTTIQMPYQYAVELICDYLGAARAYMGDKFSYGLEYDWWLKKIMSDHLKMHENTKLFITQVLRALYIHNDNHALLPMDWHSDFTIGQSDKSFKRVLHKEYLTELYNQIY